MLSVCNKSTGFLVYIHIDVCQNYMSCAPPFLAKICNTDPAALQVCKWIDTCSNAFKAQADKPCKSLAPLTKNAPPTGSQCGKSRCPPWSHSSHLGRDCKTDAIDVGEDHSPQDEIVLYGIQADVSTIATTHTKVSAEEAPTYDELFIDAIDYGTIGDTQPEKIVVEQCLCPMV